MSKKPTISTSTPQTLSPSVGVSEAIKNYLELLKTQSYADLILKLSDGKEVKCHRAVVGARVPILAKIIDEKSKDLEPGKSITIDFPFDMQTTDIFLRYVYGDYEPSRKYGNTVAGSKASDRNKRKNPANKKDQPPSLEDKVNQLGKTYDMIGLYVMTTQENHNKYFVADMRAAVVNRKYVDYKFLFPDPENNKIKRVSVNKCIVTAQCLYFSRMLSGGFKEETENAITMKDTSLDAFLCFLEYLYTGALNQLPEHAVEVLTLSDLYQVPLLKEYAQEKLVNLVDYSNVCDILEISHFHEALELRQHCVSKVLANLIECSKQASFQSLSSDVKSIFVRQQVHEIRHKDKHERAAHIISILAMKGVDKKFWKEVFTTLMVDAVERALWDRTLVSEARHSNTLRWIKKLSDTASPVYFPNAVNQTRAICQARAQSLQIPTNRFLKTLVWYKFTYTGKMETLPKHRVAGGLYEIFITLTCADDKIDEAALEKYWWNKEYEERRDRVDIVNDYHQREKKLQEKRDTIYAHQLSTEGTSPAKQTASSSSSSSKSSSSAKPAKQAASFSSGKPQWEYEDWRRSLIGWAGEQQALKYAGYAFPNFPPFFHHHKVHVLVDNKVLNQDNIFVESAVKEVAWNITSKDLVNNVLPVTAKSVNILPISRAPANLKQKEKHPTFEAFEQNFKHPTSSSSK